MSKELEKARKAAIINRTIRHCVCFGIPAIVMIKMTLDSGRFTVKTILGIVIGFAIIYGIVSGLWAILFKNKAYAKFITLYKKEMIETALNGNPLYEQQEFYYDCGLKPELINGTGLISANKLFSVCYLSGMYNGVSFFQADVRNIRGDRNGYTLEYDGTLIAIPTTLPDATQTNIYHKDVDCSIILPGSEMVTGNAAFDQVFKVRSNNHDAARVLVAGDFTNRLLSVQSQINSNIALTVKRGWMYILLPGKKSVLKPKLFGKYDDAMKLEILKELSRAKLFMDAFSR